MFLAMLDYDKRMNNGYIQCTLRKMFQLLIIHKQCNGFHHLLNKRIAQWMYLCGKKLILSRINDFKKE